MTHSFPTRRSSDLVLGRCRRVRTGAINCRAGYLSSIRRFPPHGGRYILHALAQAGHDASHGPPSPAGLPRSTPHPRFQEPAVAVESQIGPLPFGESTDVTAERSEENTSELQSLMRTSTD